MSLKKKNDSLSKTPCKASEIIFRMNSQGSMSILNVEQYQVYYEVDGVALEFWKMIDGKKTEATMIKALQLKYPGNDQKIKKLAGTWLREFKKYKLLS